MSASGVTLRYKGWLALVMTLAGLFLVAQVFMPQIRGGFLGRVPVIGPYLPGLLGLWACAVGVAYRFRPVAIVELSRLRRVGPLLGKEYVREGAVTIEGKMRLVGGEKSSVTRFLVNDDDWAYLETHLKGAAALD